MVRYGNITEPIKEQAKAEFIEEHDTILSIFKYFKIIENVMQLADDTKLSWQPEKILQQTLG